MTNDMTHFHLQFVKRNKSIFVVKSAGIIIFLPIAAFAYELPLWEFGLGAGVLQAPYYRGSKSTETIILPIPYLTYRGDFLKIDHEGIRGQFFKRDKYRLDISLAGNVPVPKSRSSARSGMPSLDPVGEVGPELEINIWNDREAIEQGVYLKIPYRLVFSVGNPILAYQGWSFSPYLNYTLIMRNSPTVTKYSLSVGPIFADSNYHNYFYKVAPKYQTSDRPTYTATAGYSGSRITLTITGNAKNYFAGAFARYDNLENAVFTDSPLVETKNYFIFGVAFAWKIGASSSTVRF